MPYEYARGKELNRFRSWRPSLPHNRTVITVQFTTVNRQTKGGAYLPRRGIRRKFANGWHPTRGDWEILKVNIDETLPFRGGASTRDSRLFI